MSKQRHWQSALQRYLNGDATPHEREVLDRWVARQQQDPAEVFKELPEPAEAIRDRMLRNLHRAQRAEKTARRLAPRWWVAASVVLLALLGGVVGYYLPEETPVAALPASPQQHRIVTQAGEQRAVTLPDGSEVQLNYDSELRYEVPFGAVQRRVYLRGEAFFNVQRDTTRPFFVDTDQVQTQVLGTSFNVTTHDQHYAVAVATGRVEVTTAGHAVRLQPDEKATLDAQTHRLVKQPGSPDDYGWTRGVLIFENLPLAQALTQLERWYGVEIISRARPTTRTITARYEKQPLDQVLESMTFLLNLHYEIGDHQRIFLTEPNP
ncbi:ferric-dicitrate binding protein FerR, regulates iron transport through sigma-19 [Catalinimonas alkaloidigena]|uniref:Ferric-dicitrate binding protein FerR, regulates iron transport through sigma-19 n=1 Tax=Catalinimonas alkaloidigena TaxID=1075417 RepID=A0A1G9SGK8_9BACT|nr:FecR domain-containing protein [Catalinimonas alkaloidigena]SDM33905.1 ferric-dicitrate binding protein FerR, regulates iron transport through sigma-19 [Catalinimonas alkaloidigena]